jgi:threonine dehydrogenase-like Zn-dependent dehydrogenase
MTGMMRAYRGFEGEPNPRLVETGIPEVGRNDVLVNVKSAGLTLGTFTLLRAGMLRPLPMTLGHEGAGVVAAVGSDVTGVKPGDRVRVHPTLSCGQCRACLTDRDQMCWGTAMMGFVSFGRTVPSYARYHNGFIADYAVAPASQIDVLPDSVSYDVGAKLHYMANALRNLRVAEMPVGGVLGILGATGSMGVATIRLAANFGVSRLVLIGRSSERLEEVRKLTSVATDIVATDRFPGDWATSQQLVRTILDAVPQGLDAIIDYLPEGGPLWQAAGAIATGGSFVNMGGAPEQFQMPVRAIVGKCLKIIGTRNHSRLDAKEVLRLLAEGALNIDDLITHRNSLDQVDEAVRALGSRAEPVWMSLVNP